MAENPILQMALDLLAEGISFIPLKARSKTPALPTWAEYQTRLPTEEEARNWFADPNLNLGIICGPVSGNLFVLDFDTAEASVKFAADYASVVHGCPVVKTARGLHLYLRSDTPVISRKLEGIDLQSTGKYVVAPGSIHPSGAEYLLYKGDLTKIPTVDTELLGLSGNDNDSENKHPEGWQDELLQGVGKGERNTTLTQLAGRYVQGRLSRPETLELLLAFAGRCSPPLDRKTVENTLNSVLKTHNRKKKKKSSKPLPRIWAGNQQLPEISEQAWSAVQTANKPPRLFLFMKRIVRIDPDGTAEDLIEQRLRHELARVADWFHYKMTKEKELEEKPAKPPLDVVKDMLAAPEYPLPELKRIVHVPVFAPSGELSLKPGYHEAGRTYYVPGELKLPAEFPTVEEARRLILDELIVDFPFAMESDRANAVALLLTPFARDLISGQVPFYLATAAKAGTGKGLLVETLLDVGTSGQYSLFPESGEEEELRKRITTLLMDGSPAFIFDNLSKDINSSVLSAGITAREWSDRILGRNETTKVLNRAVWVGTSNNPVMTTETARRTVRIRMVVEMEKPWTRTGFKHPILKTWVDENRGLLVAACLTLIRSWLEAGRPPGPVVIMGSFETFTPVLSGILHHGGITGFLQNHNLLLDETDTQGSAMCELTESWWKQHGGGAVSARELWPIAQDIESLDFPQKTERGQQTAFGKLLRKLKDSVFGDFCIMSAGKCHNAATYKLKNLKPGEPGEPGEPFHPSVHNNISSISSPSPRTTGEVSKVSKVNPLIENEGGIRI